MRGLECGDFVHILSLLLLLSCQFRYRFMQFPFPLTESSLPLLVAWWRAYRYGRFFVVVDVVVVPQLLSITFLSVLTPLLIVRSNGSTNAGCSAIFPRGELEASAKMVDIAVVDF